MLREPLHQQLLTLGLKAAALSVDRLQFSDDQIEAISLLLDTEIIERASKSQNQRIKLAKLGQSAHPADVDLRTPRNLSKIIWQRLLSLNWMKQHQHLLLIGPTGIGKSFLACALAKASIEQKNSVRYLRMPRLQDELSLVRAQGKLSLWLKNLSKIPLLILDDFGLIAMSQVDQPLLLDLIEDRYQRGSLIITSQLPIKLWHGQFTDPTLADAILDRLVHNAEIVELKGDSMRRKSIESTTTSAASFS
jgi:DNA replication protein DnaC